jgi:hypothetical protein
MGGMTGKAVPSVMKVSAVKGSGNRFSKRAVVTKKAKVSDIPLIISQITVTVLTQRRSKAPMGKKNLPFKLFQAFFLSFKIGKGKREE